MIKKEFARESARISQNRDREGVGSWSTTIVRKEFAREIREKARKKRFARGSRGWARISQNRDREGVGSWSTTIVTKGFAREIREKARKKKRFGPRICANKNEKYGKKLG